jgi:hypothetical protein
MNSSLRLSWFPTLSPGRRRKDGARKDSSSSGLRPGPLSRLFHVVSLGLAFTGSISGQSFSPDSTTAWHGGKFHVDVAGVLSRSSIILGQPNIAPGQAMPLGNGRLGVAVWSENGLTAQLNRADTLPYRLSPGQVVIPGLTALTQAKDYSGRLDLYDGEFQESGAGMTATAYVEPDTDTFIIDVTGAKADGVQTASPAFGLRARRAQLPRA